MLSKAAAGQTSRFSVAKQRSNELLLPTYDSTFSVPNSHRTALFYAGAASCLLSFYNRLWDSVRLLRIAAVCEQLTELRYCGGVNACCSARSFPASLLELVSE